MASRSRKGRRPRSRAIPKSSRRIWAVRRAPRPTSADGRSNTSAKRRANRDADKMALLEIDDIHVLYDNIEALKGVSIHVETKQIVALVGANGAGKTTTLRAVSGLLRPRSGDVRFDGESLQDIPPHEIAAMGVLHVPEGRRIFARLTVEENLAMGAFTRSDRHAIAEDRERMLTLFPRLRERLRQVAGTLSGGEQQMLATARALMGRP